VHSPDNSSVSELHQFENKNDPSCISGSIPLGLDGSREPGPYMSEEDMQIESNDEMIVMVRFVLGS
jgi:hypothetical protein